LPETHLTGTQTRTFNYGNPPGAQLLSATNPENGTVTYTYNSDKTLATKTDAKNQQVQYSFDSYKRVTQIRRGTYNGTFTEDACQQENYSYDTNPYDGTFSQNTAGRLAAVQYKGGYDPNLPPSYQVCSITFTEMYSYNSAGSPLKKRLRVSKPLAWNPTPVTSTVDLDSIYAYDNEGRMTTTQYPSTWQTNGSIWVAGPNLGNTFDSMGRLQKLTDLAASSDIVSNTSYGAAGQLLTMTGANGAPSETRYVQLDRAVDSVAIGEPERSVCLLGDAEQRQDYVRNRRRLG
jgi:YD repeat-containing protein